jgi:hypothetical protein
VPESSKANLTFDTDKFQGPALLNCASALWRRPLKLAGQLGR